MQTTQKDSLGTEPVGKLLFRLSVPAVLAQIINMLYNIVDRAYIGHIEGIGSMALTGVGLTFPIIMLISAFSSLVGMGGAPLAAIKMGEKNNQHAEKILGNCVTALFVLSVVLTTFFMIYKRPLLMVFGASGNTIDYADDYLSIYLIGTVFVQTALGLNSFINTQGFAKTGMITVVIGAALNIVLDPIFIFVFGMGVKGAALATIISQAVSAIWVLGFLFGKRTVLRIRKKNLKISPKVLLAVLGLGVSPFVMQATESLVNIVLNANLQRYGGDNAVGAMTIISSAMQMFMMPLMGLSQGAQPIVSYNYGARQFDRVKKAFHIFLISALVFSCSVWLLCEFAPQVIISVFSSDAGLLEITEWAMRIFMGGILFMGAQIACQQTFLAMGKAKVSLILALLRKVILLIPLVYILAPIFEVTGVFCAEPVADFLASATTVTVFMIYYKKLFKQPAQAVPNGGDDA